jgi:hypothetical protein
MLHQASDSFGPRQQLTTSTPVATRLIIWPLVSHFGHRLDRSKKEDLST